MHEETKKVIRKKKRYTKESEILIVSSCLNVITNFQGAIKLFSQWIRIFFHLKILPTRLSGQRPTSNNEVPDWINETRTYINGLWDSKGVTRNDFYVISLKEMISKIKNISQLLRKIWLRLENGWFSIFEQK